METVTLLLVFTVMLGIGLLLAFYISSSNSTDKIESFVDAEIAALKSKLKSRKTSHIKPRLS